MAAPPHGVPPCPRPAPFEMDRRRIAVCLAGAAAFVPLYSPQSLLPLLRHWMGQDVTLAGAIMSAGTAGVALAAPFAGLISDHLGHRRVIVFAALFAALPGALCALAPNPALLLIARFLQGLALPGIFAVTIAYIAQEWPPREARPITALYVAGTVGGGYAGRMLAGLVAEVAGWRWAFAALALLQLLLALFIVAWLTPERGLRPSNAPRIPAWRLLTRPPLAAACATGFGALFALVAGFTYISLRLAEPPFSLGPAQLSLIFTVYLISMVVTPWSGRWLNRLGHTRMLTSAWGIAIAGLAITVPDWMPSIVVGLCLFSSGLFIAQTTMTSFVGEAVPDARATAIGLYVTSYYIGGSVGGVLPAPMYHWGHWPGVAALISLAGIGAVTLGTLAFQHLRDTRQSR